MSYQLWSNKVLLDLIMRFAISTYVHISPERGILLVWNDLKFLNSSTFEITFSLSDSKKNQYGFIKCNQTFVSKCHKFLASSNLPATNLIFIPSKTDSCFVSSWWSKLAVGFSVKFVFNLIFSLEYWTNFSKFRTF